MSKILYFFSALIMTLFLLPVVDKMINVPVANEKGEIVGRLGSK